MTKKIFRSVITVAMTVLAASLIISTSFLYDYFNRVRADRLKEELSLAAAGVETGDVGYFEDFDSSLLRFTLISPAGDVLYDSQAKPEDMENHLDREEISEAIKNGHGSSARYSATLTEQTFYEAQLLSDGRVLRISSTQVTLGALILGMLPAICATVIICVVVTILLSNKMAAAVVKPLNELDLENPEKNDAYEEIAPLLTKISKQHKQISRQMKELQRKSEEFRQITDSMNEGLVLIDDKGTVLSINPSAQKLFSADNSVCGQNILTLDRTVQMSDALRKAMGGKHSQFRREINGREYRFLITPSLHGEKTVGAVLLCLDVTEAAFAERNRREFTANVSHELKSPLQGIIGSAELLENGLVKPEDTATFIGHIKTEAARLVSLINDIIRLSQLDEEAPLPLEDVELSEVAFEVTEVLASAAKKRNIEVVCDCPSCPVKGVRRYLYEIIYNLCDNAIRYNKDGGNVTISLSGDDLETVIRVSDTGIGIAPEHRARIFERFYRVDKSHSKETGGTGLGLSIVKHAVALHNGTVDLESEPDKGTVITVTLPKK